MGVLVVAGVVAALHMLFLVYMTIGGFLGLYRLAWIWPSVGVTVYSMYVTLTDFTCPVTTLEKWLLEQGGRIPYDDSFTAYYLRGTLYPAEYETAIWVGAMTLSIGSYVLSVVVHRRRATAAVAIP